MHNKKNPIQIHNVCQNMMMCSYIIFFFKVHVVQLHINAKIKIPFIIIEHYSERLLICTGILYVYLD